MGLGRVAIFGGTGSLGQALAESAIAQGADDVLILSRGEARQHNMRLQSRFADVRFLIGDVRDERAVEAAVSGCDVVINTAALKHVPVCEAQPREALMTNVIGALNVRAAAIRQSVECVVSVSTDKAVAPHNVLGLTKALQERMLQGDAEPCDTRFVGVRYGNVLGSQGSLIPTSYERLLRDEPFQVTEPEMTRFVMTMGQAVDLVFQALRDAERGETLVRLSRSATVDDLLAALLAAAGRQADYPRIVVGTRPGEKWHECLIAEPEIDSLYAITEGVVAVGSARAGNRLMSAEYRSDSAERVAPEHLVHLVEESMLGR